MLRKKVASIFGKGISAPLPFRMAPPGKSSRAALTLKEKVDIIEEHNAGKSVGDIAQKRGRPKSTIYTLLKSKSDILATWRSGDRSSNTRRVTQSKWPQLDAALFQSVTDMMAIGMDILDVTLRERALELAEKLGMADEFRASNGFLQRFKQRHQLVLKVKAGEGSEAERNSDITDWQKNVLPDLLKGYDAKDIYNTDETALFYRLLPHKTLAFKGQQCKGGKKKKDRVSLLFAVNMDGEREAHPNVDWPLCQASVLPERPQLASELPEQQERLDDK